MAAGDWIWFGNALLGQHGGTAARRIDYTADTLKVMLTTSTFTPNQDTHDFKDDVTNEVSGTGYSAGGATVTATLTYDGATNEFRITLTNPSWGPGASLTFRNAVLYKSTGTDATSPLIAYIAYAGDQAVSNGTLTISNSSPTLKITAA